jgi:hypothetical protein
MWEAHAIPLSDVAVDVYWGRPSINAVLLVGRHNAAFNRGRVFGGRYDPRNVAADDQEDDEEDAIPGTP